MINLTKKNEVVQLVETLAGTTPMQDDVAWPQSRWKLLALQLNDLKSASREIGLNPICKAATEIHDMIPGLEKANGPRREELINTIKHRLRALQSKLPGSNEQESDPDDLDNFAQQMARQSHNNLRKSTTDINKEYVANLPARLDEIDRSWKDFLLNPENKQAFETAFRQLHQLHGNASSFGFDALGDAAADTIDSFPSDHIVAAGIDTSITNQKVMELIQLGRALLDEYESPSDTVSDINAPTSVPWESSAFSDQPTIGNKLDNLSNLIYLVDNDIDMGRLLAIQIEYFGFNVQHFSDLESFNIAVAQQPPALVIMDILVPEDEEEITETVTQFRKDWNQHIPIVFLTTNGDLKTRTEAIESNGDALCPKPVDIDVLVNKVFQLTDVSAAPDFNIVVLHQADEDEERCTTRLREAGLTPTFVSQPKELLDKLEENKPNLLMVDIQANTFNGIAIAKMLRNQEKYATLPIIFLASEKPDPKTDLECRLIGEDILPIPVPMDLLGATIKRIFSEQRNLNYQLQSATHLDAWTGLHTREHYLSLLNMIHKSRTVKPADKLLINIAIDNFTHIVDSYSISAANQLLRDVADIIRDQLYDLEIAARIGEANFSAVVHVSSREDATEKAAALQGAIERHSVSSDNERIQLLCSIGCELFSNTVSSDDAYRNAVSAVKEAQFDGGSQVIFYAGNQQGNAPPQSDESASEPWVDYDSLRLLYQAVLNLRGNPQNIYQVMVGTPEDSGYAVVDQHLHEFETPARNAMFDRWILEHVLSTGKHQYLGGTGTLLFIELSEGSLRDPVFPDWLIEQIQESRIKASALGFALAEEGVARHPSLANKLYKKLRNAGCKTILGNFSGSSEVMQILKFLPVDFLRVDKKLVRNIHQQKLQLSKLTEVSKQLNQKVIAPGVSHAESMGILWESGIDYVQGDFIHAPSVLADYDFSQGMGFG